MRVPQTDSSPIPVADDLTRPYWTGLSDGDLVLPSCQVCGALNHPIATTCRACSSPRLEWLTVSPVGRLFSWTVEGRRVIEGMDPPYVIAQMTPAGCEDGEVRLIGTLLVADPATLHIGAEVRLAPAVRPGSDVSLAFFTLL